MQSNIQQCYPSFYTFYESHFFPGQTLVPPRSGTWASYQIRKIAGCACAGNAGNVFPRRRIQRKTLVSDPGMHHGTCVTHVPWCMSGLLTRGGGENVPGIPGACAPAILRIWQEAHGSLTCHMTQFERSDWLRSENFTNIYSERPRGAGFRSVNPAERWRENPARALARAGFSQHLECGIHRSESSPEGSFALIPHPVARWAKTTP